jgi:hypothetical protein
MNPSNTCYKIYVIQPRTLRVRKGTNNFLNKPTFYKIKTRLLAIGVFFWGWKPLAFCAKFDNIEWQTGFQP